MRPWALSLFMAGALGAQASFPIVGVERRGLPPYESEDRTYRLELPASTELKVGDRLKVVRRGARQALGRLKVLEVRSSQAWCVFEAAGEARPMKGDTATLEVHHWLPADTGWRPEPLPAIPPPAAPVEAPPEEGLLFFLPGSAELSPAGHRKLQAWVEAWGRAGRWAVLQPPARGKAQDLRGQRAAALQAALRSLGVDGVLLQTEPRTAEGRNEPAWIRHWD